MRGVTIGMHRVAARLAGSLMIVVAALTGFGFTQAATADEPNCYGKYIDGELVYICEGDEEGEGNDDGDSGGGNEPQCDLSHVEGRSNPHCYGELACWANIPSVLPEEMWPDDRPDPDAVYIFRYCYNPDGTYHDSWWDWYVPDEIDIVDEAWRAFGALAFPDFELAFSPAQRSLVDLDTWFWVDGPGEDPLTGSSAGGVVAIATPRHVEVDPGDGSGVMTCEWVVSETDACAHVYGRASVGGPLTSADGDPSYEGMARLVFSIHFEFNGEPLELPGLPDEFVTEWESAPVPVAESQAVVTR